MRILLIRHGETDYNLERRIQGHKDIALNARGLKQAQEVADVLVAREKIDAVISSDLLRASKTAQTIADAANAPIFSRIGLRERHMGELEGMLHSDALKKRAKDGKKSLLEYGENQDELGKRLVEAYEDVLAFANEQGYKTVAVVSHGSALNNLLEALVKSRRITFKDADIASAFRKRPKLGNCSVTIIEDGVLQAIAEQWTESIVRERDLI